MERTKKITEFALRATLAVVFAWAAVAKLANPQEFYGAVLNYKILPESFAALTAYFLPALEFVCAATILIKSYKKSALLLIVAMLLVFSGAIVSAMWRNLDMWCGCFGNSTSDTVWTLIRDIILLFMCAIIFLLNTKKFIL